ncbi:MULTISPECIES: PilN domain-containing protein [Shewanella]|uniref:MSHA biogenesis protein MshI n=1 Tax=Shewanella japonica TaxID=93973 RepID=A0ABN4Y8N1_9GAMM|nr:MULTISPECIES: fimbrial assembly protein [Shewanella]ARD20777.1 MSHA biogenesis protein MshI [Shewanella japonica]MBQ4890840.1 fimbrial assembly protein [Shewanella sp. MMG014]OBT06695.1 fimbrial assembly protein [Shewanella sp. UCD-FRSSP16_17]
MIKTTVNLYSADLLPAKLRLSFQRMMMAVGGLIVFSMLIWAIGYWSVTGLNAEVSSVSAAKSSLDTQKNALELEISTRAPDPELVASVELAQQRLDLKRLLSGELKQRENLISQGYSNLLTDLASVSDGSVWLSQININQQHFEFEGYGAQPQSIPLWVEKLKHTETLKGYAFSTMTMDRGESKPIAFKLSSTPDVEVKK